MKEQLARILTKTVVDQGIRRKDSFSYYYPASIFKPTDKEARDGKMTLAFENSNSNNITASFSLIMEASADLNVETGIVTTRKSNAGYEFRAMASNLLQKVEYRQGYLDIIEDFLDAINESHELLKKAKERNLKSVLRIKGVHIHQEEFVFEVDNLSALNLYVSRNGLSEVSSQPIIATSKYKKSHHHDSMTQTSIKWCILSPIVYVYDYDNTLRRITNKLLDLNQDLSIALNVPIDDEHIIELFAEKWGTTEGYKNQFSYTLNRIDGGFEGFIHNEEDYYENKPVFKFVLNVVSADEVNLTISQGDRWGEFKQIRQSLGITPTEAKTQIVDLQKALHTMTVATAEYKKLLK